MNPFVLFIGALFSSIFFVSTVHASKQLDNLSEKLIQLRGEVEQLNNEIHFMKQEHKQEMNFLWTQKNEVKSDIERNKKLVDRLQTDLQKKVVENQEKGQTSDSLMPEFKSSVADINNYLDNAIPFKKADRQAALAEINDQVVQNLITVQRGFNKLWAFLEDELRLTKETGLYQQSIQIEGKDRKQLVDIVRVGMMKMYFRTSDKEVGQLAGAPGEWQYKMIQNPESAKETQALFDALQKQIRTGLFSLPMKSEQ